MRKASKSAKRAANDPADLPFEEAIGRLEAVVDEMETEELSLETLLNRYEEGTRLVVACQQKLAKAEVKIRQLEENAAGEPELKPLSLDDREDQQS